MESTPKLLGIPGILHLVRTIDSIRGSKPNRNKKKKERMASHHKEKKQKLSSTSSNQKQYDFRKFEDELFTLHFAKFYPEKRVSKRLRELFPVDSINEDDDGGTVEGLWSEYVKSREEDVVKIVQSVIKDDPDGKFEPEKVPGLKDVHEQLVWSALAKAKDALKKRPTFEEILDRVSLKTEQEKKKAIYGIFAIRAEINNNDTKYAYYVCYGGAQFGAAVDFRHEGQRGREPPKIYLRDLSEIEGKVHLFYSSSGSGKTVELVGSALSRNCHLAIVISPKDGQHEYSDNDDDDDDDDEDDDDDKPNQKGYQTDRKTNLLRRMRRRLRRQRRLRGKAIKYKDLFHSVRDVVQNSSVQEGMGNLIDAIKNGNTTTLRLVVAIDEASRCPDLVRSIINDITGAENEVRSVFDHVFPVVDKTGVNYKMSVVFSVAGTGAISSTAGACPGNFSTLMPAFVLQHEYLRNKFLSYIPAKLVPGSGAERWKLDKCIDECLPVVATMMENGRMASIACHLLRKHDDFVPIVESLFVEEIALLFMRSNGLDSLLGGYSTYPVASAALAVHLFQGQRDEFFPIEKNKYQDAVCNLEFGISLSRTIGGTNIRTIVSNYGLLEPKYETWSPGSRIKKPFTMRASQQIIALHMMGMKVDILLGATPYGIEGLSTHLVKCAVAASLAVAEDERPNLQEVLSKIGFFVDENMTSEAIKSEWDGLRQYKAIGCKWERRIHGPDLSTLKEAFKRTYQMQVGLHIRPDDGEEDKLLVIDKLLSEALESLKPDPKAFLAPITCHNSGINDFADGFVTFYVGKISASSSSPSQELETDQGKDTGNTQPERFTIMNHPKGCHSISLDTTTLNDYAKRGRLNILDPYFGKKRLLCVPTTSTSLIFNENSCPTKLDFVPYCVDKCLVLQQLMTKLQNQKSMNHRVETHGVVLNSDSCRSCTGRSRQY